MKLSDSEIRVFYKLWYSLVWGINEKHGIIPRFKRPVYGTRIAVSIEDFMKIRSAMWERPQWINEFLADHDDGEFTEQERGIIMGWRRYFVKGKFLVMKHLAKYSVLMTFGGEPTLLYGVCGISDPVKDTFPYPAPFPVELVLLPFKDKIVYDSLAATYNISFGSGMRASAKEWYDEAKNQYGIIEVLNGEMPATRPRDEKPKKKTVRSKAAPTDGAVVVPKGVNVPKAMSARYMEIAEIIEKFCDEKMNGEYKEICLRALQKLCRKRPSPLVSGKARTWACGIVYAIGSNNFIFDKSQSVNMTATEISEWFALAKSTAGNKAAEIGKLLDLSRFNTEFMLKRFIDNNPSLWYLRVNGYVVDIREMPGEVQEEAFRKGLIPYIPADKGE